MTDHPASTRTRAAPVLHAAARQSLHAPSVFNTKPWRWRVTSDALELRVDPRRQLVVTDPESRLLVLSCGAALHHARVALAADGWDAVCRVRAHHDTGTIHHGRSECRRRRVDAGTNDEGAQS